MTSTFSGTTKFHMCKIAKNLEILFRLGRYLNLRMLRNLYYTLINPHLHYGLMSWGITYKTKLNQISSKHNKCIRYIFFANRQEDPDPYYKFLGILKLENLIKLNIASFANQIRNKDSDTNQLFSEFLNLRL